MSPLDHRMADNEFHNRSMAPFLQHNKISDPHLNITPRLNESKGQNTTHQASNEDYKKTSEFFQQHIQDDKQPAMRKTAHLNIFDANEDDQPDNRHNYQLDDEMFKSANSLLSVNDKTSISKTNELLLTELDLPCLQHQFNAHGSVYHLNSRVSKKDLFTYNRAANAKMNEIIVKLKHPQAKSKMIINSDMLQQLKQLHQRSKPYIDDTETAMVSLQSKNQIATLFTGTDGQFGK